MIHNKKLLITKDEQYINNEKWNSLVLEGYKINDLFEKYLETFRGNYDCGKVYKNNDIFWKDNQLCTISKKQLLKINEHNAVDGTNAISDGEIVYFLDEKKYLKKQSQNAVTTVLEVPITAFKVFDTMLIANRGQRLFKIVLNEYIPLNISFSDSLIDYTADENYIFYIEGDKIKYGNIINDDNTLYDEIEIGDGFKRIDNSSKYIYALNNTGDIKIINKKSKEITELKIEVIGEDLKMISANDSTLIIYNGSKLTAYHHEDGKLQKTYEFSIPGIINFSSSTITQIINGSIYEYAATKELIEPFNFESIFMKSAKIDCPYLIGGIDYENGQYNSNILSIKSCNGEKTSATSGLTLKEKHISYDLKTELENKSIVIELYSDKEINDIGYISQNKKKALLMCNGISGHIKLFIAFYKTTYETFLYQDNKFIKSITNEYSQDDTNILMFNKLNVEYKSIAILGKLFDKHEIDFISKNKLFIKPSSINNSNPFSPIYTDDKGNAPIQIASSDIPGAVKISGDLNNNDEKTTISMKAFQTFSKNILEKIQTILTSYAKKIHRHKWNEIDEIPSATKTTKGIVFLSSDIEDDDSKAASVKTVFNVKKIAEHSHPYLSLNGGKINGTVEITDTLNSSCGVFAHLKSAYIKNSTIESEDCKITNINSTTVNTSSLKASSIDGENVNAKNLYINGYRISVGD